MCLTAILKIINKDEEIKKFNNSTLSNHFHGSLKYGATNKLLISIKPILLISTAMNTRKISSVLEYLMIPV
ncbi:hypothetical protein D3C81_495060 [compost metagenome]